MAELTPVPNAPTAPITIAPPSMDNPLLASIAQLLQSPVNFGAAPQPRGQMDTFIPLALGNIASALSGNERYGQNAQSTLNSEEEARRAEGARIANLSAADVLNRRQGLLQTKLDMLDKEFEAAKATGNIAAQRDALDAQLKVNKELAGLHEAGETDRLHESIKADRQKQQDYLDAWKQITEMQANAPLKRTGDPYTDQLLAQSEERRKILSDMYGAMTKLKYKPDQFNKFIKEHPEEAKALRLFDESTLRPLKGETADLFYRRVGGLTGDNARTEGLLKKYFPKETFKGTNDNAPPATPPQTGFQRDMSALGSHPLITPQGIAGSGQNPMGQAMLMMLLQGMSGMGNYLTSPIDTTGARK